MIAKLGKASDWDFEKKVEVETIEDCLKFHDQVIIAKAKQWDKDDGFEDIDIVITIYDSWVE